MPSRHHGRGTLPIQRAFGGVKIRRASGTNDPATYAAILSTLDALGKVGRLDLLQEVARGDRTPLAVHQLISAGQVPAPLAEGAPAPSALSLAEAVSDFLAGYGKGSRHMADARYWLERLTREGAEALGRPPLVSDLRRLLERQRATHMRGPGQSSFNTLLAAARMLVKWHYSTDSQAWRDLGRVERFEIAPAARRRHKPLEPWEADQIRVELNAEREGLGDAWWALCTTGMRPSEYWGKQYRYESRWAWRILGTKTTAALRVIPAIEPSIPRPPLGYGKASVIFRRVIARMYPVPEGEPLALTWYDARRTFAAWMERAGVSASDRRRYMGHGAADVTEHYARKPEPAPGGTEQVEVYQADAEALRGYIVRVVEAYLRRHEEAGSRIRPRTPDRQPLDLATLKQQIFASSAKT